MRNTRVAMLAAAAAALGVAGGFGNAPSTGSAHEATQLRNAGHKVPGTLLGNNGNPLNLYPNFYGYGEGPRLTYKKRQGWTVAEDRRRSAKRRNILRAKGHHRQAVR